MLTFNYFPLENANIQQPDMWSRWMLPLYFPENTPKDDAEYDPKIIDPVTHKVIVGTRVSMEDLLVLRKYQ